MKLSKKLKECLKAEASEHGKSVEEMAIEIFEDYFSDELDKMDEE